MVSNYRLLNNKRGIYCSSTCSQKASTLGIYVKCDYCGEMTFQRHYQSKINEHNFCSSDCRGKYYSEINSVTLVCQYCGIEYKMKKSHEESSKFCSRKCKDNYHSEFLVGENNPSYSRIICKCTECGKEIAITQNRFEKSERFYCSRECMLKYMHRPENMTAKQREGQKVFLAKSLENRKTSLTKPHVAINKILESEGINYKNEKFIKYYLLDIHIIDYNLGIEIQGDFWHCSPLDYSEPKYKQQKNSIARDKSKHTYVKNKYGYEILYLWEADIEKNLELCRNLIWLYIRNKGILENYHSFNYFIDDFGSIRLSDCLLIPFQDK